MFQSAPPARGATDLDLPHVFLYGVSIRAPRTGGDSVPSLASELMTVFQSAPPARGATVVHMTAHPAWHGFNPRPPHGGRLEVEVERCGVLLVSIRAPRTGGDQEPATTA